MPRTLSSDMIAAIHGGYIKPILFVQLTFRSVGAVYFWSGSGSLSWNGHTWAGIGSVLSIATVEDAATVQARGTTIILSGLDATTLGDAMTEFQLGAPV